MPRNGSGIYSKPAGTTAVADTVIESAKYNSQVDDMVADLNAARPITAGGTGATTASGARSNLGLAIGVNIPELRTSRGMLWGCSLANNAIDPTNDIDVQSGYSASDEAEPVIMATNLITKRLDAAWAVGSGNGGRMSAAAVVDGTYHVHLIMRPDTGVVDVGFDVSATAPTLPTNYTKFRRIGSIRRETGVIVAFTQNGNLFQRVTAASIYNSTAASVATLRDSGCPAGIACQPIVSMTSVANPSSELFNLMGSASAGGTQNTVMRLVSPAVTPLAANYIIPSIYTTNLSAQLYFATTIGSGTIGGNQFFNLGWYDTRGRDA